MTITLAGFGALNEVVECQPVTLAFPIRKSRNAEPWATSKAVLHWGREVVRRSELSEDPHDQLGKLALRSAVAPDTWSSKRTRRRLRL